MARPGKARDKKANRFIAHQPVYKCIGLYQDMSCNGIKTVDQLAEFKCSHLFSEFCRTPHICKKHRQNHLRAAGMFINFTGLTKTGIVFRLISSE